MRCPFPVPAEIVRSVWEVIESCEVKVVHFSSRQRLSLPGPVTCQLAQGGMDVCH